MHIDKNPSGLHLTVFGVLWLLVFSLMGALAWERAGTNIRMISFFAIALLVPAIGLVWHEALRRVYLLALYATMPMGMTVSFLLLMAVYYGVVTPIGYLLRLAGYDPMQRKWDRDAKTYWVSRETDTEAKRYFQQF